MIKYLDRNLIKSCNPPLVTYNFQLNMIAYLEDPILFLSPSALLMQLIKHLLVFLEDLQEICMNLLVLKVPRFYRSQSFHILMILRVAIKIVPDILLITFQGIEWLILSIPKHIPGHPFLNKSGPNHYKAQQILFLRIDQYPLHQYIAFRLFFLLIYLYTLLLISVSFIRISAYGLQEPFLKVRMIFDIISFP